VRRPESCRVQVPRPKNLRGTVGIGSVVTLANALSCRLEGCWLVTGDFLLTARSPGTCAGRPALPLNGAATKLLNNSFNIADVVPTRPEKPIITRGFVKAQTP
jgi:hypothetical protein